MLFRLTIGSRVTRPHQSLGRDIERIRIPSDGNRTKMRMFRLASGGGRGTNDAHMHFFVPSGARRLRKSSNHTYESHRMKASARQGLGRFRTSCWCPRVANCASSSEWKDGFHALFPVAGSLVRFWPWCLLRRLLVNANNDRLHDPRTRFPVHDSGGIQQVDHTARGRHHRRPTAGAVDRERKQIRRQSAAAVVSRKSLNDQALIAPQVGRPPSQPMSTLL